MSISQEQDQINSFILKQKNTPFTQTSDEIQARNTPNGQAVFRVKTHTLQLTNVNQLDHIIHYLVVEQGFMMSRCSKSRVEFTHSQNDFNNSTTYYYNPEDMVMFKYEDEFLAFI